MSKYVVKSFGPIKIEEKWPQPPQNCLFQNFEAPPLPSWLGVGRPRKMETDHSQTQGAESLVNSKLLELKLEA